MNPFLAGLLDRAEGRAPILERRPRALFEPHPGAESRLVEPLEQDDVVVGEAPRYRTTGSSGVEQDQRGEARPSVARVEQSLNAPPLTGPAEHARESAASAPRGAFVAVDVSPVRPRAKPSEPDPAARPATRIETVVERHESLVTVTKVVDARHGSEPTAPIREGRADESSRKPDRRRGADASSQTNQTTVVIERSRMIPAPTPRQSQRAAAEAAVRLAHAQANVVARHEARAATPSPVQITIGRVDVRAVSDKREGSQAKGPAAPRLSLDEYLRQRGGAER